VLARRKGFIMLLRVAGVVLLSLALGACGDKSDPQKERTLTPPTVTKTTKPLPTASATDIESSLMMPELGTVLKPSDMIESTAMDDAVLITRLKDGEIQTTGRTKGAFWRIPNSNTLDYSGQTLEISVTAKSALDTPSTLMIAYSTAIKGNSGWKSFETGSDYKTYSFTYKVEPGEDRTPDFVGIAVAEGAEVIVSKISINVAP